jgi:hypothetical protein
MRDTDDSLKPMTRAKSVWANSKKRDARKTARVKTTPGSTAGTGAEWCVLIAGERLSEFHFNGNAG